MTPKQEQPLDLNTKLSALDRVYRLYDRFVPQQDLACKKFCTDCCTRNVTLTTLEGFRIIDSLVATHGENLLEALHRDAAKSRFTPRISINQLARWCAEGKEPPDEPNDLFDEKCPLLHDDACLIYAARPFGCRCMLSKQPCGSSGYADMDEFVLTVNTVCLQVIEHIDADGLTGNLTDMLIFLESDEHRHAYRAEGSTVPAGGLIQNRALSVLMIPPAHRTRIEPLLTALRQIATAA